MSRSRINLIFNVEHQAAFRVVCKVNCSMCLYYNLKSFADLYYCRTEFRKSIGLDKKDFGAIEYLLRKGQRQVDMYSAAGIKDIK
jgi:hypothetical protein